MRHFIVLSGVALAVLCLLAAAVVATAAPAPQNGPTLNVVAGQGDGVVKMQGFVPDKLRVAQGTTVTWTVNSDEEHGIAFLAGTTVSLERTVPQPEDPSRPRMANPRIFDAVPPRGPYDGSYFVNSGPLGRGQSFSVTFASTGSFEFLCPLHPRVMTGVVEVVPAGSAGITTQQQADAEAAAHMARDHGPQVEQLLATRNRAASTDGPADSKIWFARAGTGWRTYLPEIGHLDIDAFLPDSLTVRQGDTIVWTVDHDVPHTITFLPPGQAPPEIWAPMLPDGTLVTPGMAPPADPSVQPRLVSVNRQPVKPAASYDGHSLYSSGQLGGDPPTPQGMAWALTFDTPGTYEYLCLLHAGTGMRGQITVTPRE